MIRALLLCLLASTPSLALAVCDTMLQPTDRIGDVKAKLSCLGTENAALRKELKELRARPSPTVGTRVPPRIHNADVFMEKPETFPPSICIAKAISVVTKRGGKVVAQGNTWVDLELSGNAVTVNCGVTVASLAQVILAGQNHSAITDLATVLRTEIFPWSHAQITGIDVKTSIVSLQDRNPTLEEQLARKTETLAKLEQQHTRLLADKTGRASVTERDLRAKIASLEAASITEREKQIGQLLSNQRPIKSPAGDVAPTPTFRNGTASKLVQQGSTDKPLSRADTTPVQTIFENEYFKAIATSVRFSSDRRNIRVTVELHNKNAAPLYLAINSFSGTEPAATTESGDKFESVHISGLKSIGSLREDTYEQSSNYTAIPEVGSIRTTWELTSKHGEPPAQGKLLELTAELLRLSDSGPKRVSFVAPKVVL